MKGIPVNSINPNRGHYSPPPTVTQPTDPRVEAREMVEHYLKHLRTACERAEVAVGLRHGETIDPERSLRMALRDMDSEVQRLRERLAGLGADFDTISEGGEVR